MKKCLGMQATFRAAEEEQRQVIAKHGQDLSIEALNDMKVCTLLAQHSDCVSDTVHCDGWP